MPERTCRFISDRTSGDSPDRLLSGEIFEKYIEPVVTSNFTDFSAHLFSYQDTPGLSEQFMDDLLNVDLVIADITHLNQHAFYALGIRRQSGKPLVLIADEEHTVPLRPVDLSFVPYRYDENGFVEDEPAARQLVEEIARELAEEGTSSFRIRGRIPVRRETLVKRLNEAAAAVRLLRINSASETADELEAIAKILDTEPAEAVEISAQKALVAFLDIIAQLADQLSSVRGARMLISGVISIVLGGGGVSSVAAYAISLAFWEGKEPFLRAIEAFRIGRAK